MNFTAMDFETANNRPESACSLALVMVRNNEIVDRFYTVINPQMPFDGRNIRIHSITAEDVKMHLQWLRCGQKSRNYINRGC